MCSASARPPCRRTQRAPLVLVGEEVSIAVDRLVGAGDLDDLPPGLEPLLHARARVADDAGPRHRELEGPHRRGCVDRGVSLPRHGEIDAAARDVLAQAAERAVRELLDPAETVEAVPADCEPRLVQRGRRGADHGVEPAVAVLGGVAVEEDVDVLVDLDRGVELWVGRVVERVGAAGAERAELVLAADGVRQHAVELPEVRPVVDPKAGREPAMAGQARRDVAVVEQDRSIEAGAQLAGDAAEVVRRHRDQDDGIDRLMGRQDRRQVAHPARRRDGVGEAAYGGPGPALATVAPDGTRPASEGQQRSAGRRVGVAGEPRRVGVRGPPRGGRDRTVVGGHVERGAALVETLEQLPPCGRRREGRIEIERRADDEQGRRSSARRRRQAHPASTGRARRGARAEARCAVPEAATAIDRLAPHAADERTLGRL